MQGVPTDAETVAEFRALYLHSGNAAAVARELDIPERTGRKIAERLEEDPSFAEDGRKLRATYLDRLTRMRMSMAETAHARFHDDNGGIDVRNFGGEENATVVITDKRHEYGKLVLDAEKNAQALAKAEAGPDADPKPVEVHVHLKGEPDDGDGK